MKTKTMITCALFAAVICVFSVITIPTGIVSFIGGSASISPDTTGGDTVKFFVWSNYFQPLTQTDIQTVGE